MTLALRRSASARDVMPALWIAGGAILLFAGYCQIHSWFDATRVPLDVSFKWGLAMGIPSTAAALLLWQNALRLANWVNGRISSAVTLWAAIAAIGVALSAAVHVAIGDANLQSYPAKLLSRMYDLIPEVGALAAFTVCLVLLRHAIQPREVPSEQHSSECEWLSFPEAPALMLRTRDIYYVKSAGNYCEIYADGRTHLIRLPLGEAAVRLESLGFLRIHRTLIVNGRCIVELDRSRRSRTPSVLIENGERLPIGNAYLPSVRTRLENRL
jgi:LytTr DNA-binding domain